MRSTHVKLSALSRYSPATRLMTSSSASSSETDSTCGRSADGVERATAGVRSSIAANSETFTWSLFFGINVTSTGGDPQPV